MIIKLLLPLLLFSQLSVAATTGAGKIETMMNAYGGWIFQIDHTNDNPNNCSKSVIILKSSHAQYSELYSHLLAAYTSGKPILIYTTECDSNGYVVMTNIWSDWGK